MKRDNSRLRRLLPGILTVLVLACLPATAPAPIATTDPNALVTAIAETANSAASQTALAVSPTPSLTETPPPTATLTATVTPTFIYILPTWTHSPTPIVPGSSGIAYQCLLQSVSPENDTTFHAGDVFDVIWKVQNVGREVWRHTEVDLGYYRGDKFYIQQAFDFEKSVAPGGVIELIVPMKAPSQPGTYSTEWRLYHGNRAFCPLKLTIIVN
jgi:hypothetical protein